MDRTRFPGSHQRASYLHYDAEPNNYACERVSPPRDRTWAAVIECALLAGIGLIVAIRLIG